MIDKGLGSERDEPLPSTCGLILGVLLVFVVAVGFYWVGMTLVNLNQQKRSEFKPPTRTREMGPLE